jgi:hypothetical protein
MNLQGTSRTIGYKWPYLSDQGAGSTPLNLGYTKRPQILGFFLHYTFLHDLFAKVLTKKLNAVRTKTHLCLGQQQLALCKMEKPLSGTFINNQIQYF